MVRKCKFCTQKKKKKKNCNDALNKLPKILHGNSALKKWKFHAQKWKVCTQKMENVPNAMESFFSVIFCAQFCTAVLTS